MGAEIYLKRKSHTGGTERIRIEDTVLNSHNICEQILVTFYTMEEIFDMWSTHHFDTYGNLIIRSTGDEEILATLAPVHFSDLGTKQHINKGCGFDLEDTFIKIRHDNKDKS